MPGHPKSTSINIINWNANGIRSRTSELLDLMASTDSSVALVCETHLQPGHQLRLTNHTVYRTDRPGGKAFGGTAVIVRNTVRHEELVLPELYRLEATGVCLHTAKGPLRVIAVYSPPQALIIELDIEALLDTDQPTIIAGDLNAKHPDWNSPTANPAGRKLRAHSMREGFRISGPTEPTRIPTHPRHKPSVLDITISKNLTQSLDMETITALSSDHSPVLLMVGDDLVHVPQRPKLQWHRADWKLFQDTLTKKISTSQIETSSDLDEAVSQITLNIQTSIADSVPLTVSTCNTRFNLPEHIHRVILDKNRAKRRWQRYRTPDLREIWQTKQKTVDAIIKEHRQTKWNEVISELNYEDHSIWSMTRRLLNKPTPNPPIQGKTHLACNAKDKAEVLADSLQEQFTPNPPSRITSSVTAQVDHYLDAHQQSDHKDDPTPITLSEMETHVKRLKNKKAPGIDGITNQVIKELPGIACERLVDIFNASLRLQHFPRPWKEAKVVAFPKPGKSHRDPANWRPISLLSGLSKLLERAILSRLMEYNESNGGFIDQQFGFRKHHSTNHQLLRVVNRIRNGFNRKTHTAGVFLDVAKAFDRVWHTGLVHKLAVANFPPHLVNIMESYLRGRSFHVAMHGDRSTSRPIAAGVPQGSILAPFLYNIYTNDIPVNTDTSDLALYADDAAILVQSESIEMIETNLQVTLDTISAWFRDWRINVNADKTTATFFTRRRTRPKPPNVTLLGQHLTWTITSKYLGVVLDNRLSWKPHIDSILGKVQAKLGALGPILRNDNMSLEAKVRLYNTIIRPTITYGSPVWATCSPTLRHRLQVAQNRCLKIAARLPIFARTDILHRDLEVAMLEDFLTSINTEFFSHLQDHPNKIIRGQVANLP